jgi:hypothetical protein
MTKPLAQHLIVKANGVGGTVYACPFCRHSERVPRHPPGRAPSGHGWRTTALLTGALVQHMRSAHAPQVAAALTHMAADIKVRGGWRGDTAKLAVLKTKRRENP